MSNLKQLVLNAIKEYATGTSQAYERAKTSAYEAIDILESELSASQSREAELREKLEAAEARIKASHEQEPVAFAYPVSGGTPLLGRAGDSGDGGYGIRSEKAYGDMLGAIALYAQPPIPPELAELQRELTKSVREACSLAVENAELRKLLESKAPEGKKVVECWGCEGTPAGANDPCEVCGRSSAQPKEPKQ